MSDRSLILAIETATSACSVALGEGNVLATRYQLGTNIHSLRLLEMVQQVLAEAGAKIGDLRAVAVGQGPGSFTGLRIGIGAAQGIAFGAGCGMIGVSSLAVLANQVREESPIIAGIDARMGEVYWATFERRGSNLEQLSKTRVTPPEQITAADDEWTLVGNAWDEYRTRISQSLVGQTDVPENLRYPHADAMLELAAIKYRNKEVVAPAGFVPDYVRNEVARKPAMPTGQRISN